MRLTLIALLLAGVVGCYWETGNNPGRPVEEPKLETGNGGGEELDPEFEATLKAAEQGDADAQYNLGLLYDNGEGVHEDDTEAVKWYRKAAEQGNTAAQTNLGFMYFEGTGVSQDDTEAVKWYRKAAEQGHADAQWTLGHAYYYGTGVPEDHAEAYAWFSVAATNGAGPGAVEFRDKIKRDLSPTRLAQAQKRARELFEQINANKAD